MRNETEESSKGEENPLRAYARAFSGAFFASWTLAPSRGRREV